MHRDIALMKNPTCLFVFYLLEVGGDYLSVCLFDGGAT